MSEGPPTDENGEEGKGKKSPNLIVLPGGKKVDPSDVGAGYVVKQTGDVPTPDIVDPVQADEELRRRERFVQGEKLVKAAHGGATTGEMMDLLVKEITEELAHLKFERRKASEEGKNTANYSVGRMNSLKSLAELLLKCREADRAEALDLKSPRFQAVFKIWMEFFNEAMEKSGIRPQDIDLVFQQMKADMVDWEKRMSDVR